MDIMKVRDVMTKNPVSIKPDDTVSEAWSCFNKFRIWSLPVIENGELIGIVTKRDLKVRSNNQKQKISAIMSKNPMTISPDEELAIAADKLKRARINALLVSEGSHFIGILTKYDINKKLLLKSIKVHCTFCDSLISDSDLKCPNCGATRSKNDDK